MSLDLVDALHQIEREKDIPVQTLVRTIEASLVSAYRKNYGGAGDIRVEIDLERNTFRVFARRTVVQEGETSHSEIGLVEAQRYRPNIKAGEVIEFEVTPRNFGRIAAQTAKQVMVQRIREAERELIFDEFSGKEGELVSGEIQRRERRFVTVSVGRAEAILPPSEQVDSEEYRPGQRMKFYIVEVRKTTRSPQVVVSRSHPGLVKRLFELEVPELHEGIIELKAVSRHPGSRSKIAVHTNDPNVDPVGACVGHRGSRVQAVVEELGGEKIDIIRWNPELTEFISAALSPAKVPKVVLQQDRQSCIVVVPEDQLSLAIGKSGQNVRLAARLTGCRIDIRGEQQWAQEQAPAGAPDEAEPPSGQTPEAPQPDTVTPVNAPPVADSPGPTDASATTEDSPPLPAAESISTDAPSPAEDGRQPPAVPAAMQAGPAAQSLVTPAAQEDPRLCSPPVESAPEAPSTDDSPPVAQPVSGLPETVVSPAGTPSSPTGGDAGS